MGLEIVKSLFEQHVGEVFNLRDLGDQPIALTLTEVLGPDERILQQARELGIREPFSLLFYGPPESFLNQRMYLLQHEELDTLELFLVPVNQDENGFFYEAVFN